MALGDDNAEDEKEEKPKVYKSAIDSEDVASTSRSSHRPVVVGVGEQDDVKQEKNDVCLEANVQPCPSTSGSTSGAGPSSGDKHPSKDPSTSVGACGSATTAVNGASPKSGNGKSSNVPTASVPSTCTDAGRSTAFTRTYSNRINGLDAFMNGLSANANYYVGMPPGLAYLAAAGPSSGGSSSAHGVIHPMASYPHNLPVLYQAAAATAHLMGNRFPGSPNPASSPFSFQQGAPPFPGFSPCYPTAADGGQTAPSQAAAGPAAFPFALCGDPKTVGIRSPFGFFAAGQCSPSFGPPMLIQPSVLEQWYAAARFGSPMFPLMMTAAGAASAPMPCSPAGTLSPIVNSSPIAGGAPTLTPTSALAPPALIPAYPPTPYGAGNLRFPSSAASTATNALAAMSQIPLPVVTTSVKSVASNMVASAGSSSSSTRSSLTQNGSTSANINCISSARSRTSSNMTLEQRHDENGIASHSTVAHASSRSHEKALKKMTHIKKPLNAFMLYMKEMRPIVMQEVGLKERQSAEINRILGRRWHSLTRDEQQKYYDLARHERTLHMQRYPNWSARDNYALHKKKKRKRDKAQENLEMKKCRARFGLDQQAKWCKHCRRKKKCLWFREGAGTSASTASSGIQENGGADSAEQSPPCAQVTSTTNGPDALASSSTVLATETDVNSPQSLVTSTITIAVGGRAAPPSANGGGSNKKKVSVSTASAVPKNGTNRSAQSPPRKKRRRTESMGAECTDDEDAEASSSASEDDEASSDEDEFFEDEIDEEAEAAAAARAAVEGADFDDEMAALISPPSSDQHHNGLTDEGQPPSTVT